MNFDIENLGACTISASKVMKNPVTEKFYASDDQRMLFDVFTDKDGSPGKDNRTLEIAGPREKIYFEPEKVRAAIVTCGGLCPGLNDVIRAIVMASYYSYGIKSLIGIRYGYNGLNPAMGFDPIELTPQLVEEIHLDGGTILGSSRGGTDDMELLVTTIKKLGINILFTIGGDGTLRGAHQINETAKKMGLELSVIGIPKTIDNDISYIQRSFGFETAFSKAVDSIYSAHIEAKGAPNGIGLVKLMGRHSGFIAANAALAQNDVNFLLIPEVPFELDGKNGFLAHLAARIEKRQHAVICVAEGAGQDLLKKEERAPAKDASGNVLLDDIGLFLKAKIKEYFSARGTPVSLKYIDPSYIIRSAPAVPNDSIFCARLGQYAVHAAMAGKTDLVIGLWNNIFIHIPIEMAISERKKINPDSPFWYNVLEATGQPVTMAGG